MSILITGKNGQDGRIIFDKYVAIGKNVYGVGRDEVSYPAGNKYQSEKIDICDPRSFKEFLDYVRPSHILHLAASHANSVGMELHGENAESEMFSLHVGATQTILDWQKENSRISTKLVVALSSQMFTATENLVWVDEHTPLVPSSKYGETKSKAFELVRDYREKYNVHAAGAILFNHSSRFSRPDFVLMEIAKQIVAVLSGATDKIFLRNFNVELDISSAENICKALIGMVSLDSPEDFVLASGQPTNLKKLTLDCLKYYKISSEVELISTNPTQILQKALLGNTKKASSKLNWQPDQDSLPLLVDIVECLRG
jgi:GDPmannose 4,6-dehydratase